MLVKSMKVKQEPHGRVFSKQKTHHGVILVEVGTPSLEIRSTKQGNRNVLEISINNQGWKTPLIRQ